MNKITNLTYLTEENESDDSENDDKLEYEELYDSGLDIDYMQSPSESDDSEGFEGFKKPLAKKKWRTSTPRKAVTSDPVTPDDSTASYEPASSVVPPTTPSTSDDIPVATPDASTSRGRKRRRTEDVPSVLPTTVDFKKSTIASKHGFMWSCRPLSQVRIRTAK